MLSCDHRSPSACKRQAAAAMDGTRQTCLATGMTPRCHNLVAGIPEFFHTEQTAEGAIRFKGLAVGFESFRRWDRRRDQTRSSG